MSNDDLCYFDAGEGRRIAYRLCAPANAARPTIMFLPGYASDMSGTKAAALDAFAEASGCGCLLFDYSGTGASGGYFQEASLRHWLDEVLAAIDQLARGPIILVGSSMGRLADAPCRAEQARSHRRIGRGRRGSGFHRVGIYA